ncbi:unnamed protein product [marine sediment metagenome]|uniref:Uncharacterized protein n=1 Tax=marine sediment metagenome TaxID=412755 RepID=X0W6I9_9ZZZZ
MGNGKTIGLGLFIGGIILLIIYGISLGFEELVQAMNLITGFLVGITLIGLLVLIISIVFEQKKDTKETLKDIKKEDLEP